MAVTRGHHALVAQKVRRSSASYTFRLSALSLGSALDQVLTVNKEQTHKP